MKDFRAKPIHRMVVIGESIAFGMTASDPRNEWVQTVANLLRDFQDVPLHVINNAIPANVISPRSPAYRNLSEYARPSALERYQKDLIDLNPDLAVIAYGLNDSRCGYEAEKFLDDLATIIKDTRQNTEALIVLTSPYWNTQYNQKLWNSLDEIPDFGDFSVTGDELVKEYITGIQKLASKYGCLFVDLYSPTEGCTWLLNKDRCHYNDVGQRMIGQLIFNKIVSNCSFTGLKSQRIEEEGDFNINNTGGTKGKGNIIASWLKNQ